MRRLSGRGVCFDGSVAGTLWHSSGVIMATGGGIVSYVISGKSVGVGGVFTEGESSESDGEAEPAKAFRRIISTNKEIKCSVSIKEGFLMKQTSSFQRWRKRYFKLKGRKLYYAKDTKVCVL
ncbi:hypothetical protein SK128_008772 [Halocaridina rubra]|uniref:PH domain-containing protein n=1 Tax=Halocaridina rubra TaxID=373956 RepID=A0AAN8WFP1_HALRR